MGVISAVIRAMLSPNPFSSFHTFSLSHHIPRPMSVVSNSSGSTEANFIRRQNAPQRGATKRKIQAIQRGSLDQRVSWKAPRGPKSESRKPRVEAVVLGMKISSPSTRVCCDRAQMARQV